MIYSALPLCGIMREDSRLSIFFGTVFSVYIIINAYMVIRLYSTLDGFPAVRALACFIFFLFAASFPVSRLLEGKMPPLCSNIASLMSAIYLSPMIYAFLLTLLVDILRLLNNFFTVTRALPLYSAKARLLTAVFVFTGAVVITLIGAWNAGNPIIVERNVPNGDLSLKIAVLSDIHLGRLTGPRYLEKLVALVNASAPDIVLLAGDTLDGPDFFSDEDREKENAAVLSSFESRLGTWAVMGNHDYYAGLAAAEGFFESTNVRLLIDEAELLDGKFVLVGRNDRTVSRFGGERKDINDIITPVVPRDDNAAYPVIVMDHQPFALEEAETAGAALQVSGHTHRGQLFPFNFLVAGMYEKSYGLYKRGGANYYISSGAGVWGTPVRTVGRPEVVIINLGKKAEEH